MGRLIYPPSRRSVRAYVRPEGAFNICGAPPPHRRPGCSAAEGRDLALLTKVYANL